MSELDVKAESVDDQIGKDYEKIIWKKKLF